jgi:hypothetical protein
VTRTTVVFSEQVARELYPIALKQARQDMIIDLFSAALILTVAVAMWVSGAPRFHSLVSALGGGAATIRGMGRWRRLRRMHPTEAAARGEL